MEVVAQEDLLQAASTVNKGANDFCRELAATMARAMCVLILGRAIA